MMASSNLEDFYEQCCSRPQDSSDVRENFQHPTRLINFLVGQKGKNEAMAIGGPWSPSLDGQDPLNDTTVLIKTAIRTTKALTGIDLSDCLHWYVFIFIFSANNLSIKTFTLVLSYATFLHACVPITMVYLKIVVCSYRGIVDV